MRSFRADNIYPYAGANFSGSIKILVIINISVFILVNLFSRFPWFSLFGLVPRYVFAKFMIWQPLTYLFLHSGLWHLIINMLMLWMFGSIIESAWGSRRFLFYYLFTGVAAGLCSIVFAFGSGVPVVGASGAIFGILVAYAVMFPESIILLFFIFPMKMKYAVLVLAGINLLGAMSASSSGIAYIAHLGGGVFGYLYLKSEFIKRQFMYLDPHAVFSRWQLRKAQNRQRQDKEFNQKVDAILDKISKQGMESLTPNEKKILEAKSRMP